MNTEERVIDDEPISEERVIIDKLISGEYLILKISLVENFYSDEWINVINSNGGEFADDIAELVISYYDENYASQMFSVGTRHMFLEYNEYDDLIKLIEDTTKMSIFKLTRGHFDYL